MARISFAGLTLLASVLFSAISAEKTCVVGHNNKDDSFAIIQAFNDCKTGGTVSFPANGKWYPKSLIKVTDLENVKINFAGHIILPPYDAKYKRKPAYFELTGKNINMFGGGTITGNGQTWWDKGDNTGPIVLRTTAKNSVFGHFNIIGAPNGHIAVTASEDVVFENIYLRSKSQNKNFARNTDAWGVSWSKNVVFRNSEVTVGDDCTAINGGVTNITISNVKCIEGHGFSITGSLDLSRPEHFKSVYFYNNECNGCQNGIRIKTTAGATGTVDDIQYKNMSLVNVENPIQVTTHYFCQQDGTCGNDKSLSVTNVLIENVHGSTSWKDLPVLSIDCSKHGLCSKFSIKGLDIKKNSSTKKNVCNYLVESQLISQCKQ
ncbi:unnamed protein product [Rhizopus stolonifer]